MSPCVEQGGEGYEDVEGAEGVSMYASGHTHPLRPSQEQRVVGFTKVDGLLHQETGVPLEGRSGKR